MESVPGKAARPRPEDTGLLLTTDELAAKLRTTPSTIRYWRHKGYGPIGMKAGRRVLYRLNDVEAWLDRLAAQEH